MFLFVGSLKYAIVKQATSEANLFTIDDKCTVENRP